LPKREIFLETYLREIGVHTPVSLLSFGAEKPIQAAALEVEQVKLGEQINAADQAIDQSVDQTEVLPDSALPQAVVPDLKPLQALALDASTCRLCGLADARQKVVFGAGNAQADLLFVGETPKPDEDLKGESFVGAAGDMLGRMLSAIGLNRDDVYLVNAIKCSTPNNRDPRPDEVQACKLWLDQQLDIVQPKIICLLGKVAAQTVLNSGETLTALRGRWHAYRGIPVWVSYHPAYLMRSPRQKQKSWQDFSQLSQRLKELS